MWEKLKSIPEATPLITVAIIGTLFFTLTDPASVPPVFFVFGFGLLLIGLYLVLRVAGRLSGLKARLKPVRYHGLILGGAILPVMLLALQSIGQLTVEDVLVLVILFLAGYFYVSRMYSDR